MIDRRRLFIGLRLADEGGRIDWISTDPSGHETAATEEPGSDCLLRPHLWLLTPFAAEDLL